MNSPATFQQGSAPSSLMDGPRWLLAAALAIVAGASLAVGGPLAVVVVPAVALTALFLGKPFLLFCLFAASLSVEALTTLIPGSVYSLTVVKVLGFAMVLGLIVHIFRTRKFPEVDLPALLVLVFLGWVLLSHVKAVNSSEAWRLTLTLVQLSILWLASRMLVDSLSRFTILMRVAAITMACSAIFAIVDYIRDPLERIEGVSFNASLLAADMYIGLAAGIYLVRIAKGKLPKLSWSVVAGLCALGLLVSLSRAAYVMFLPVLVVAGFYMRQTKKAIAIGVVFVGLSLLAAPIILNRLRETTMSDGSTVAHLRTLQSGIACVIDNPLLGVGVGNFQEYYLGYTNDPRGLAKTGHNSWLTVAAETGVPGVLLFLGLHVTALIALGRVGGLGRAAGCCEAQSQVGVLAAMVAVFMLIGLMHDLHVAKYLWIVLGLCQRPRPVWCHAGVEEDDFV